MFPLLLRQSLPSFRRLRIFSSIFRSCLVYPRETAFRGFADDSTLMSKVAEKEKKAPSNSKESRKDAFADVKYFSGAPIKLVSVQADKNKRSYRTAAAAGIGEKNFEFLDTKICKLETHSDGSSQNRTRDSPYSEVFENKAQILRDFAVQLEREKRGVVVVPGVFMKPGTKLTIYDHIYAEIQQLWKDRLMEKFEEQKARRARKVEKRKHQQINIAPFLCQLKKQDYVDIMYDEACRLSEFTDCHGLPLKVLRNNLARKLMSRIKIELAEQYGIIEKISNTYDRYSEYFLDWPKCADLNHREFWKKSAAEVNPSNPNLNLNDLANENDRLLYELGEFLYKIIIDSLKVPVSLSEAAKAYRAKKTIVGEVKMVGAFFKALSTYNVRCYAEIRAHRTLMSLKKRLAQRDIRFDASEMPTICPPIPWHQHSQGQLLVKSIDLIRLEPISAKSLEQTNRIVAKGEDMHVVMDSLNVLGSTPWMMNQPVLDIMLQIFRGDGDMKLDIPPPQSKLPPLPHVPKNGLSQEEKAALMKKRQEMKKAHAELYSLWCTVHYRFSQALFFKDKLLWFPHNVDFRGRTYPVPPHLNHMGDDMCRGMMLFSKGRPLGKDGLRWLKIHCINLTGLKKRQSVDERAVFADEIIEDILDSARNPLQGRRWWTKSEEPWQTLAVCMEIEKAMRMERPEEYVCYLPVHQDGSCNGLQHYAALGRDQQGAEQVNLEPAAVPQDIYSTVAARIEEKRAKDAEAGLQIAQVLEGFVRRKVIKQTVMTTVYGVTKYGGRAQIGRQLKDIEEFPQEFVFQASMYLVERLFESVGEIFVTARQIQDWFVQSAGLISGKLGRTVEWVTPLGFPVAQPYFRPAKSSSFGKEEPQSEKSPGRSLVAELKPDSRKQKNAFPPNYIHSLDSTHMMLTALHCHDQGITYAAVHDSFWTHPCTIADLNRICREQFVALHSQPLLNNLSRFFVKHYVEPEMRKLERAKESKESVKRLKELVKIRDSFESLPQLGCFDLKSVKGSVYFFS